MISIWYLRIQVIHLRPCEYGQRYLFSPSSYLGVNTFVGGYGVSVGTNGIVVCEIYPRITYGIYYDALLSWAVNITSWTHIVVSFLDRIPILYVNGSLVHVGIQSRLDMILAPSQLAGSQFGRYAGGVDDVRLWGSVLNVSDVFNAYNNIIDVTKNQLMAYWNFNEGSKCSFCL